MDPRPTSCGGPTRRRVLLRRRGGGALVMSVAPARELEPRPLPDAEHLIAYHIMTSDLLGRPRRRGAGAAPAGTRSSSPMATSFRFEPAGPEGARPLYEGPETPLRTVRIGATSGEHASLVCGFLGCDARPSTRCSRRSRGACTYGRIATGWLAEFPRQVVAEAWQTRAGGSTMLTRMAELMFVEVLRRYTEELSPQQDGWLAGLRDPVVAPALAALHARPRARLDAGGAIARRGDVAHGTDSGSRRPWDCRRCSTSRNGGSSSRPSCSRPARGRWRR